MAHRSVGRMTTTEKTDNGWSSDVGLDNAVVGRGVGTAICGNGLDNGLGKKSNVKKGST